MVNAEVTEAIRAAVREYVRAVDALPAARESADAAQIRAAWRRVDSTLNAWRDVDPLAPRSATPYER